jgi:glycosyltransferase involved in cell wall biosynthesis
MNYRKTEWEILDIEPIFSVNYEYIVTLLTFKNVFVLPNFINEKYYVQDKVTKTNSKSIIYLGGVRRNNREIFVPLIKAMKYLKDYSLTLVGHISDIDSIDGDESTKEMLDKMEIADNVKFIGQVSGEEKLKVIQQHEIGFGVGRSMKEMALLGLPVFMCRDYVTDYITEDDINDLAYYGFTARYANQQTEEEKIEKIIKVIQGKKEKLSRTKAVEYFGLNKNIHVYEETFQNVISSWEKKDEDK